MMTELNAHVHAATNWEVDETRYERAKGPQDVLRVCAMRLADQTYQITGESHTAKAMLTSLESIPEQVNLSTHLVELFFCVLLASDHWPIEDQRAFMKWSVGTATERGYLPILLQRFFDTASKEQLNRIVEHCKSRLQILAERDHKLFGTLIRTLPAPQQRLIQGLLYEYKLAILEANGVKAKSEIAQARRLAEHLVRSQRAAHHALALPMPQLPAPTPPKKELPMLPEQRQPTKPA